MISRLDDGRQDGKSSLDDEDGTDDGGSGAAANLAPKYRGEPEQPLSDAHHEEDFDERKCLKSSMYRLSATWTKSRNSRTDIGLDTSKASGTFTTTTEGSSELFCCAKTRKLKPTGESRGAALESS